MTTITPQPVGQPVGLESGFKMYAPTGLQVYCKVFGSGDPEANIGELLDYVQRLADIGFTVDPPAAPAGSRIESVDAYALGESKKGDACVYLYSTNHGLQFRIATVWVERFGELPFTPTGRVWPGGAPERDTAVAKGYLVDIPPMDIIMELQYGPDGEPRKTERGNPVFDFGGVKGHLPKTNTSKAETGKAETGKADVCPRCKGDWRFYSDACPHVQPNGERLSAIHGGQPLPPGRLRVWLTACANDPEYKAEPISEIAMASLEGRLSETFGTEWPAALFALTGRREVANCPFPVVLAIRSWLNGDPAVVKAEVAALKEKLHADTPH